MAKRGPQRDYDADYKSVLASVGRDGKRQWLYVDIVWGFWRKMRAIVACGLIAFYLALPFLSIGGEAFFRIDIANRKFILLGQTFWPQDIFYMLFFVLLAIIGTVAMVAILGRVFCGWLCPHNVFLEMVYRPIEAFFEGKAHRRRQRDEQKDRSRLPRKFAKFIAYVLVSGVLANTATAVFVGTEAFIAGLIVDPVAHPSAALFFAFFFGLCLFNFGWFREQTCTIVCPYGRLQAALIDQHTLTVAYDPNRGEPRGADRKEDGGCIDCYRCVAVCPTGIDIRNGNQLECIHCSACIDACDDVMARLGQPPKLISYTAENTLLGKKRQIIRPRIILYMVVLTVLATATIIAVLQRVPLEIHLKRYTAGAVVVTRDDGSTAVRRLVNLQVINKTGDDQLVSFSLPETPGARIITMDTELQVPAAEMKEPQLFVEVPASAFNQAQQDFDLLVQSPVHQKRISISLDRP